MIEQINKILKAIKENGEDTNIFFIEDTLNEIVNEGLTKIPNFGDQRLGQRLWNYYVKHNPDVKDHYASFHQHVFYMTDKEFNDSIKDDV